MSKHITGFRFYFDKDFNYLLNEELENLNNRQSLIRAKERLRMYANLYVRDLKSKVEKVNCKICLSKEKLQYDHIIPISKGGKNIVENIQVLCRTCNIRKSNKII